MTIKENTIIQVKHLSKKYKIGMDRGYKTFSESVINLLKSPLKTIKNIRKHNDIFWALKEINFEVNHGEILGIIGRNGAGKSTLLKILSRITQPTEGEIVLRGRVGSLLEVGTGFHPELTGRENIYFNGAILGMKKQEIENKFDEIVEFSGVRKFLDTPLKRYSSGMQVRLAFSVAAHMDPEILLIDEVLAVGDIQFQQKCLNKMKEVTSIGRTVLFISHNMNAIRRLCDKVILLEQGQVIKIGDTETICAEYEKQSLETLSKLINPVIRDQSAKGYREGPKMAKIELRNKKGNLQNNYSYGDSFDLIINLPDASKKTNKEYSAIWFLHDHLEQQLAIGWSYPMDNVRFTSEDRILVCRIGPLNLPIGLYSFRIVLHVPHYDNFDDWNNAISFRVVSCDPFGTCYDYPGDHQCTFFLPHKWKSVK